jgi:transposase InsO family protein
MTKQAVKQISRNRYSQELKAEALALAKQAEEFAIVKKRRPGSLPKTSRSTRSQVCLYSRLAGAWAMSKRMSVQLTCDALSIALTHRRRPEGLVCTRIGVARIEAIHAERFIAREEMRHTVFEYIEVDYNRSRRHSANGFISPEAFEDQLVA